MFPLQTFRPHLQIGYSRPSKWLTAQHYSQDVTWLNAMGSVSSAQLQYLNWQIIHLANLCVGYLYGVLSPGWIANGVSSCVGTWWQALEKGKFKNLKICVLDSPWVLVTHGFCRVQCTVGLDVVVVVVMPTLWHEAGGRPEPPPVGRWEYLQVKYNSKRFFLNFLLFRLSGWSCLISGRAW